jgi:hypothetical protein
MCRNKIDYSDYLKKHNIRDAHALRLAHKMFSVGKLSSFLEVIPTYSQSGYDLNRRAQFLLLYLELTPSEQKIILKLIAQISKSRRKKV